MVEIKNISGRKQRVMDQKLGYVANRNGPSTYHLYVGVRGAGSFSLRIESYIGKEIFFGESAFSGINWDQLG